MKKSERITKDTRPFKAQKRTYLQGTILRMFEYHCELNDLKDAEYLRSIVIEHLRSTYEINHAGGIVKIKR